MGMTRREAIEALEYLISDECTDTKMDYVAEIQMAINDMKTCEANNPRVLTLEELIGIYNLRENHSWVYNTPPYLYMDYGKDTGYWIAWSDIVSCLERRYPKYIPEDYGKTWRCWSAKPSDAERKAVAWND